MFRKWLRASVGFGLVIGLGAVPRAAVTQQIPALLDNTRPVTDSTARAADPSVLRSLRAAVRTDLLDPAGTVTRFRLQTFDGVELVLARQQSSANEFGDITWTGRVEGDAEGRATFVVVEGTVAGTIRTSGVDLSLRHDRGGHLLSEVDVSRLPDGTDDYVEDPPIATARPGNPDLRAKPTIDLLVLYTPAVKKNLGNSAAVRALASLGATEANQALTDSKSKATFRVVKTAQIKYTEGATMVIDLDFLKVFGDKVLDKAWKLRNRFGADLVMLLVDRVDPDRCGRANKAAGVGPAFVNSAYSIVRRDCVSPNYSYAHELGHNTGLNHGRDDGAVSAGAFEYGRGLHSPSGLFRTIMATTAGGTEKRVLHFSNPKVKEQGQSTGIKHTKADSADSARSINKSAASIAAYRACKVKCG